MKRETSDKDEQSDKEETKEEDEMEKGGVGGERKGGRRRIYF